MRATGYEAHQSAKRIERLWLRKHKRRTPPPEGYWAWKTACTSILSLHCETFKQKRNQDTFVSKMKCRRRRHPKSGRFCPGARHERNPSGAEWMAVFRRTEEYGRGVRTASK